MRKISLIIAFSGLLLAFINNVYLNIQMLSIVSAGLLFIAYILILTTKKEVNEYPTLIATIKQEYPTLLCMAGVILFTLQSWVQKEHQLTISLMSNGLLLLGIGLQNRKTNRKNKIQ